MKAFFVIALIALATAASECDNLEQGPCGEKTGCIFDESCRDTVCGDLVEGTCAEGFKNTADAQVDCAWSGAVCKDKPTAENPATCEWYTGQTLCDAAPACYFVAATEEVKAQCKTATSCSDITYGAACASWGEDANKVECKWNGKVCTAPVAGCGFYVMKTECEAETGCAFSSDKADVEGTCKTAAACGDYVYEAVCKDIGTLKCKFNGEACVKDENSDKCKFWATEGKCKVAKACKWNAASTTDKCLEATTCAELNKENCGLGVGSKTCEWGTTCKDKPADTKDCTKLEKAACEADADCEWNTDTTKCEAGFSLASISALVALFVCALFLF